jgi:hypothetical protein
MRIQTLALLAAILIEGAGVCLGQTANTVTTIRIDEVNGEITAMPSLASLSTTSAAGTFEWVSQTPNTRFRIEFLFGNPCDRKSSHLDLTGSTSARCQVLPNHEGTYLYRVVRRGKSKNSKAPIALARIGSCEACFPDTVTQFIGIACDRHKTAIAVPAKFFVKQRSTVDWIGIGPGKPQWTVTFSGPSPCDSDAVDAKHPNCKATGAAAQYSYEVKLEGCAVPGHGAVTVN